MALSVSVLAACSGNSGNDTKPVDQPDSEVVETPRGPIVARFSGMPAETMNQHTNSSAETSTLISYIVGTPLDIVYNEADEKVEFIPNHLAELPQSDDNVVWTLKFRDGIKFTDGTPIDAELYAYSWKMLLDKNLANYGAMSLITSIPVLNASQYSKGEAEWEEVGIKVINANTLEITLETAMPEIDVFVALTSTNLAPVHKELYEAGMDADRTETTYGTTLAETPSSGAYKMTEWVRDQFRKFEKVTDSPVAHVYTPDIIESRVVTEASVRLQLWENGEIESASVSGENYDRYREDPRVVFTEASTVWGFYVNAASETNPALANKDFRHALFWATNREALSKGIFRTFKNAPYFISTYCLDGDIEGGQKYRNTPGAMALIAENDGYNVEKAREYFNKAYEALGSKKLSVEITYFDGQETMKRLAEVAQEEYEKAFGTDKFEVKLRAMPPNAAYDSYYEGKFELGIGARTQNPFNPWSSMQVWTSTFPQKAEAFYNKEFDALQERTTKGDLLLDPQGRLAALVEMERMLLDELPMIPIFQNDNAVVYQDRVRLVTNGAFVAGVGHAVLQADFLD